MTHTNILTHIILRLSEKHLKCLREDNTLHHSPLASLQDAMHPQTPYETRPSPIVHTIANCSLRLLFASQLHSVVTARFRSVSLLRVIALRCLDLLFQVAVILFCGTTRFMLCSLLK